MILWLNGTFGAGKTTTSNAFVEARSGWRAFDPEHVGYLLQSNLKGLAFDDFQDLPPWRRLVPMVMHEIRSFTNDNIVASQTVLVERYWTELMASMAARGDEVVHVLLDCDEDVLRQRITADEVESQAMQWRLDHLTTYREAKHWMFAAADLTIDTTERSTAEVVAAIAAACNQA